MFLKGTRHLLQSIQLCDAIGSPAAAEYRQNQRRIGQKLGRAHLLPKRVLQRERRQRMAHFDDAVHDARRAQIIRRTRLSVGIRLSAPCRMVSSRSASISRSSSSRPLSLTGGPADPCQLITVLRRARKPAAAVHGCRSPLPDFCGHSQIPRKSSSRSALLREFER